MNIFKPTLNEELELMHKIGKGRFGSECKHELIKNNTCVKCLRKVWKPKKKGRITNAKPKHNNLK